MNETMFNELDDILGKVKGDIIEFRVYKGGNFGHLVRLGEKHKRNVIGMDTFAGLESPCMFRDKNLHGYTCFPKGYAKTSSDITHSNIKSVAGKAPYKLLEGNLLDTLSKVPKASKVAVAVVDMLQYWPTKQVLEFLQNRMAEGGIIYFLHFIHNDLTLSSLAVSEFLEEYQDKIVPYDDIILNDNVQHVRRVIWDSSNKTNNVIDIPVVRRNSPTDAEITVALVLRGGGDTYTGRYVNALAANIRSHTTLNINLTVLTDIPHEIDMSIVDTVIPLKHKYKGWWSKIELFRPNMFTTDRVAYFDLDTVIVSNIDDILRTETTFAGIRDLYHWDILQTGVIVWDSSKNHQIYSNFAKDPASCISKYVQGDANWVRANITEYDYLQDMFPNRIVSFKANCLNKATGKVTIPKGASIVCFHGKPRPHTINDSAITRHWKY